LRLGSHGTNYDKLDEADWKEFPRVAVYAGLGVRTLINAKGPATRLSGGIMRPEVAAAMAEASQFSVDIAELQAAASRIIAEGDAAPHARRPKDCGGKNAWLACLASPGFDLGPQVAKYALKSV
jgi:seryl-tRNA(Sec) selenium transferase